MHKTVHQRRVEAFMQQAGQEVPAVPTMPDPETRVLRAKLILEEALETIVRGLGVEVRIHHEDDGVMRSFTIDSKSIVSNQGNHFDHEDVTLWVAREPDMQEIADGCADISVVTIGTLSACGIADEPLLAEVDEANLRKFGPGGYRSDGSDGNPAGKWIKPKDWTPPNIQQVLDAQATPTRSGVTVKGINQNTVSVRLSDDKAGMTVFRAASNQPQMSLFGPPVTEGEIRSLLDAFTAWQAERGLTSSHETAKAHTLFEAIAHGDQEHREWLDTAIRDFFAGHPVQRPQGEGARAYAERLYDALHGLVAYERTVFPNEAEAYNEAMKNAEAAMLSWHEYQST